MSRDFLGAQAIDWLRLGRDLPSTCTRLVLSDVDGVITRGEGQPAELDVIAQLADCNQRAQHDDPLTPPSPCAPAARRPTSS